MKYTFLTLLFIPAAVFSQNSPKEVVNFALKNMTNGNFKALLEVTDGSEKRKAEELLTQIEADPKSKESLMGEYSLLKSYTIEEVTHITNNGRELAVVATRWVIKVPLERAPKNMISSNKDANTERIAYMDYMVEYKNKKWKIISRRTL